MGKAKPRKPWTVRDVINTGYAAYKAGQQARQLYNTFTTGGRKKYMGGGGGVTLQHDRMVQYKKKRMPRKKRIRWKKFVKKVKAVADKDRGVCTWTYNGSMDPTTLMFDTNTNIYMQAAGAVHLYGNKGANLVGAGNLLEIGCDDLNVIVANHEKTAPAGSDTICFHSAVLDMTYYNHNEFGLEVDVYDVVYSKTTPNFINLLSRMIVEVNAGALNPLVAGSSLTHRKNRIDYRGVTPFEMGTAIGALRFKIMSKQKFFIPAGNSATKQYRDPRNLQLKKEYQQREEGIVLPGFTRSFIIVAKSPYIPQTPGSTYLGLEIRTTRTYKFTIEGVSDDTTQFIQQ